VLNDDEIIDAIRRAYADKLPDWKTAEFKRVRRNLGVHSKGTLFSKVDTLFPNEHPESKNHCIDSYEPITKGSIGKAFNNLQRIFSNSSFSVTASDATLAFVSGTNFAGQNLFNFFVSEWIQKCVTDDPNGLLAVYPKEYLDQHPGEYVRFVESENIKSSFLTGRLTADFISRARQ
jgi:hypothetical protein